MSRTIFLTVFLSLVVLIEVYVFFALKGTFRTGWAMRAARIGYWVSVGIEAAAVATIFVIFSGGYSRSNILVNLLMGLGFALILTKILLSAFFLIDDVVRLVQWLFSKGASAIGKGPEVVEMPARRKFIGQLGLVVVGIPFAGAVYGMLKGKYDFTLHKETLAFPDLPEAFDGMKIVQISDIHAGTFDSMSGVQAGLDLIMEQGADMILFTGDLVNNLATEVEPYVAMFSKLSAPMGKYSVLGNHDYGHYYQFDSQQEKINNHLAIREQNARMGFQMLHNEFLRLERDGQSIVLAGVENWGLPPFPQYGDLNKATEGLEDHEFTILMSHDPSHWDAQVRAHRKHIHLQLSGHTHGAQFGIEIPGVKWSPAQYRYRQWAGLYSEGRHRLYVNRGFGHIGFPGRVGIWPEVTLIELRRG
ncbi:MAG: metallophosphoesterase [Bacteroidia bacterium]